MAGHPRLSLCPFCRSRARLIEGGDRYFIQCAGADCFAAVGEGYDRDACPDHMFVRPSAAIAAWNRRAPTQDAETIQALRDQIATLRAALEKAITLGLVAFEIDDKAPEEAKPLEDLMAAIFNEAQAALFESRPTVVNAGPAA